MSIFEFFSGCFSRCKVLLFIVLSLIAAIPATSMADEWHYKNLIVGDRPAGMGGAYTAVSDTPEGAFYNPAGIVYGVGRSLSVSVNAFHSTWTTYEGVLGGGDWTRTSSSLVPNFFGMVQPLGKGKLAFSYAVPDIIEEDQNQVFLNVPGFTSLTFNLSNLEKTYKIGPSYALKLSDTFAIGLTLYGHYRQEKLVFSQFLLNTSAEYEWTTFNKKFSEYGIDPKIGFMWSPEDTMSFGLTISKVNILKSSSRWQSTAKTNIPSGITETTSPSVTEFDNENKYPMSISVGVALFPTESLLISGDIDYYEKVESENKDSVVNLSLGAEYYFSEKYALRGGFFTSMSNELVLADEDIDMYGISGSFTLFTRNSATTFGINYGYGEGDALIVAGSPSYKMTRNSLTLFVSGASNF